MGQTGFLWQGLEELRAALRHLPAEMRVHAQPIVTEEAEQAAEEIRAAYPRRTRGTGNLVKGVKLSHLVAGQFAAGAIVKNTAKHAWIFELGTQARHTDIGANRGTMPPGHVFVPIVMKHRRRMYERLQGVMEDAGLVVKVV